MTVQYICCITLWRNYVFIKKEVLSVSFYWIWQVFTTQIKRENVKKCFCWHSQIQWKVPRENKLCKLWITNWKDGMLNIETKHSNRKVLYEDQFMLDCLGRNFAKESLNIFTEMFRCRIHNTLVSNHVNSDHFPSFSCLDRLKC